MTFKQYLIEKAKKKKARKKKATKKSYHPFYGWGVYGGYYGDQSGAD